MGSKKINIINMKRIEKSELSNYISTEELAKLLRQSTHGGIRKLAKNGTLGVYLLGHTHYFMREQVKEWLNIDNLEEPFFFRSEIATKYGISQETVLRLSNNGIFPHYRLNESKGCKFLYRISELEESFETLLDPVLVKDKKHYQFLRKVNDLTGLFGKFLVMVQESSPEILSKRDFGIFIDIVLGNITNEELEKKYNTSYQNINIRYNNIVGRFNEFLNIAMLGHSKNNENILLIAENKLLKQKLSELSVEKNVEVQSIKKVEVSMKVLLDTKLENLDISTRAFTCLKSAGIRTLGEIATLESGDILNLRNSGKKTRNELEYMLEQKGIWFGYRGYQYVE